MRTRKLRLSIIFATALLTMLAGTPQLFSETPNNGGHSENQSLGSSMSPTLLDDGRALAAVLNECKRHSGSLIGREIGELQKRLGKEMVPSGAADIQTMLRVSDECTSYLSSPSLVSGMELPAAQEARREADNTLQKLDEISRRLVGTDLRQLKARTREHLESPAASQSASLGARSSLATGSTSTANVRPIAVYERVATGPDLPGRMPTERVQAILIEATQEANRDTDSFLSEAASTVSADLIAIQNATMRYPNFASHPLMQSISSLKRQLGKKLQPKNVNDVETVTDLLSRTLRIFGGSEFGVAYEHVEAETNAIREYRTRQAAISNSASAIAEIERTLDQGNLAAADSRYQQVATDHFMSGFSPAKHYLAETTTLRRELSAFREASQVPRVRPEQTPSTQVSVLANEAAKAEAYSGNSLASTLLSRAAAADKQTVQSRLASLPAFEFDAKNYKVQPITSEIIARNLYTRLQELNGKLSSARELVELVGNESAMANVRLLFGESMEFELRRKGTSIPAAQQAATNLSSAIDTHERLVRAAEARKQAALEEQQALAGKVVNGALIVVMLEEKFQRTSIMGYQMEANKQRQALHALLQRDRNLLTPQVWKAVQSEFERLMPGLTVYQASATQSLLANLRQTSK